MESYSVSPKKPMPAYFSSSLVWSLKSWLASTLHFNQRCQEGNQTTKWKAVFLTQKSPSKATKLKAFWCFTIPPGKLPSPWAPDSLCLFATDVLQGGVFRGLREDLRLLTAKNRWKLPQNKIWDTHKKAVNWLRKFLDSFCITSFLLPCKIVNSFIVVTALSFPSTGNHHRARKKRCGNTGFR